MPKVVNTDGKVFYLMRNPSDSFFSQTCVIKSDLKITTIVDSITHYSLKRDELDRISNNEYRAFGFYIYTKPDTLTIDMDGLKDDILLGDKNTYFTYFFDKYSAQKKYSLYIFPEFFYEFIKPATSEYEKENLKSLHSWCMEMVNTFIYDHNKYGIDDNTRTIFFEVPKFKGKYTQRGLDYNLVNSIVQAIIYKYEELNSLKDLNGRVKNFIAAGANPNATDDTINGTNILAYFVMNSEDIENSLEIVKTLVFAGADLKTTLEYLDRLKKNNKLTENQLNIWAFLYFQYKKKWSNVYTKFRVLRSEHHLKIPIDVNERLLFYIGRAELIKDTKIINKEIIKDAIISGAQVNRKYARDPWGKIISGNKVYKAETEGISVIYPIHFACAVRSDITDEQVKTIIDLLIENGADKTVKGDGANWFKEYKPNGTIIDWAISFKRPGLATLLKDDPITNPTIPEGFSGNADKFREYALDLVGYSPKTSPSDRSSPLSSQTGGCKAVGSLAIPIVLIGLLIGAIVVLRKTGYAKKLKKIRK